MIVLYATLVFACVWFGVAYSKKLHARYSIFHDLYQFLKVYEDNLSFRQDNLKDLVSRFIEDNKSDLSNIINTILIQGQAEQKNDYLTTKELVFIQDVLSSLGRSDKDTELQQVRHLQFMVNSRVQTAKATKEKYSTLSIKIGFLIGLLLVVLLL